MSLKTVDTRSKSWVKRMEKHIEALRNSGATVSDIPAKMRLDIRVQPGGLNADQVKLLKEIGKEHNVKVMISEFQY